LVTTGAYAIVDGSGSQDLELTRRFLAHAASVPERLVLAEPLDLNRSGSREDRWKRLERRAGSTADVVGVVAALVGMA
jgi:hypothetical protein